jgi:mono/diheme cytochrome c family protein
LAGEPKTEAQVSAARIVLAAAILFAVGLSACGRQGGRGMGASAIQDRSSDSPAEALFVEKCAMCHRQMGMGTVILARRMEREQAMLENRTDLTAELVESVVRQGVGNMPRISRGEVSDEELDAIAQYLAKSKQP